MAFINDRLEQLLNEEEGSALDFKRDQYPFEGADNNTKSELLKDILAFANTLRPVTAFILIGVEEVREGHNRVVGVNCHLDDAELQQFVNSKTQKPVIFSYRCYGVNCRYIGVIEIPAQEGPIYLTKGFGKLEAEKVYVRRGSSTDIASPEEIVQMGTMRQSRVGAGQVISTAQQRLEHWHKSGEDRFRHILTDSNGVNWPVSIMDHHYQFSYLISTENDEVVNTDTLKRVLQEVVSRIHHPSFVWRMFDPLNQYPDNVAKFVPENTDGSGKDVIEVNLTADPSFDTSLPDFWRVTPDGRASLIRAYREDRQYNAVSTGRSAGTWLSPKLLILEVAELVAHARLFAHHFNSATSILFLCTWTGLAGRMLDDFRPDYHLTRYNYQSRSNLRITQNRCTLSESTTDWKTIVIGLGRPVLRLFDFPDCDQAFVEECCHGLSIQGE
ncbi:MAG: ATP-binding protein [Gemmatimonadetes bacterium]|nr:ATP-binding protein [Gemmatimonadota bacterium]MYD26019.1 ATP-binding protein [Gemmatimonadota bacterium]